MQVCPFVKDGYCLIKNIGFQMDRFKRKCITKLEKVQDECIRKILRLLAVLARLPLILDSLPAIGRVILKLQIPNPPHFFSPRVRSQSLSHPTLKYQLRQRRSFSSIRDNCPEIYHWGKSDGKDSMNMSELHLQGNVRRCHHM